MLALQRLGTQFGKSGPQLKVALLAEAELLGGLDGSESFALALDEHREFAGDFIVGADRETAGGSDQSLVLQIELCHDCFLHKRSGNAARNSASQG